MAMFADNVGAKYILSLSYGNQKSETRVHLHPMNSIASISNAKQCGLRSSYLTNNVEDSNNYSRNKAPIKIDPHPHNHKSAAENVCVCRRNKQKEQSNETISVNWCT
jgi:hypothetical protein